MIIEKSIKIEVYPHDLPELMTYNDAVKAVAELGDDWRIPTLEELLFVYSKKDEIGGFCTSYSGSDGYPGWYWSSTEYRDSPSNVDFVRFSDGNTGWYLKDTIRLSCRPVRLVVAPPAPVNHSII